MPDVRDVEELRAQGHVVIEGFLSAAELRAVRAALAPHLGQERLGRNAFEGRRTQRVYNLPALGRVFADMIEHPRILAICDAFLAPNYLLTAAQAINILPGEVPQAIHFDDGFYPFPRPRAAISLATIVAIDDFTTENGATEIIPGSHLWGNELPDGVVSGGDFAQDTTYGRGAAGSENFLMQSTRSEAVTSATLAPVVMSAGAVVVFLGTLWHRGGANRSAAPRLALSMQYCEPWARQQENFTLGVPREVARTLSPRVQELLGYNIHPPFMGHVNGLHPKRLLDER